MLLQHIKRISHAKWDAEYRSRILQVRLLRRLLWYFESWAKPRGCCVLFRKHHSSSGWLNRETFLAGRVDTQKSESIVDSTSWWPYSKCFKEDLLIKLESYSLVMLTKHSAWISHEEGVRCPQHIWWSTKCKSRYRDLLEEIGRSSFSDDDKRPTYSLRPEAHRRESTV